MDVELVSKVDVFQGAVGEERAKSLETVDANGRAWRDGGRFMTPVDFANLVAEVDGVVAF